MSITTSRKRALTAVALLALLAAVAGLLLASRDDGTDAMPHASDPLGDASRLVNVVAVAEITVIDTLDPSDLDGGEYRNPIVTAQLDRTIWQPERTVFGEPGKSLSPTLQFHTLTFEDYEIGQSYVVFLGWHPHKPLGIPWVSQYALEGEGEASQAFGDVEHGRAIVDRLTASDVVAEASTLPSGEAPEVAALVALIEEEQERHAAIARGDETNEPGPIVRTALGLPATPDSPTWASDAWTDRDPTDRLLPTELDAPARSIENALGTDLVFYEVLIVDTSRFDASTTHLGLEVEGVGLLGRATRDRERGDTAIVGFAPAQARVRLVAWTPDSKLREFNTIGGWVAPSKDTLAMVDLDGRSFVADLSARSPSLVELTRAEYEAYVMSRAPEDDGRARSELDE